MCGIAGIILKPDQSLPDLRPRLTAMHDAMIHRGPDEGDIFIAPGERVGLVNRRLAIRDLSPTGHMPMRNPAGTVCITFNGEIFNNDALRADLQAQGYRFRGTSDTESILYGYEAWGPAVVERLRGQFAIAIYDGRNPSAPQVFIARDHMGIKPLYYAETPQAFLFASELRALHAAGLAPKALNPTGLVGYLLTGSVPNPYTIYKGVHALRPAHRISIALPLRGAVTPQEYWRLPDHIIEHTPGPDEVVEQVEALLAEAVQVRMVSDVPLGAFLSGGLDSSAVVALMRRASEGEIRTCSMVFEEATYSEQHYAQAVAQATGAEHYERVITAADIDAEFQNILAAMDQPSIDGVNTYFVSKTAREAGLTVALSGLGGDELFGGYPNTFGDVPRVMRALRAVQRVPAGAWLAQRAIGVMPARPGWSRLSDALARPASLASAYWTRRGLFSPGEVAHLVSPDLLAGVDPAFDLVQHVAERANGHAANGQNGHRDVFNWVSRAELRTYTHHQLLRDTDVMSMAHSLEVRVPLLDIRLVEAVLKLPHASKLGEDGIPKPLLARALHQDLPSIVTQRRDKMGFIFPFDVWMRGSLNDDVRDLLAGAGSSGWLQPGATAHLMDDFEARRLHWSRVWALAVLGAIDLA